MHVLATWKTCIFFFFESLDLSMKPNSTRIWAVTYHKCDQGRLKRACAFVQSHQGLAAHSKF